MQSATTHKRCDGAAFDVEALAKAINRRREQYNRLNPARPVRITPAMSRILENDDEYLPYRERIPGKKHRRVTNPTIATLVDIAQALDTTVGDLLGEPRIHVTAGDRQHLVAVARYLVAVARYLVTVFHLEMPVKDPNVTS